MIQKKKHEVEAVQLPPGSALQPTANLKLVGGILYQQVIVTHEGTSCPLWLPVPSE